MQERFGLDCISYLTEVSIRPDTAPPEDADTEARRRFLEKQIDFKRRELSDLLTRLQEVQQPGLPMPRFVRRLLGRAG